MFFSDQCFKYETKEKDWTEIANLNVARKNAASLTLKDEFWILGGESRMQIEKSTEILDKDENGTLVWRMGPEMPYSLTGHCVVQLSKNKFFLIGGLFKDIVKFLKITLGGAVVNYYSGQQWEQEHPSLQSRHLFLYDSKNETNPWTERSPMTERRFGHSCGLITVDGDKKIVVAGGQTGDVMTKSNIRQIEIYDIEVHNDVF